LKRIGVAVALVMVVLAAGWYYEFGRSRGATAHGTVNGKRVEIQYSAPSVRGRRIFGPDGLLSRDPTYPVWRAGANAATTLVSDGDLDVGGLHVPAGTYTLFVMVEDPDAWELIVNRETGQWGLSYDPARDLGRVRMAMSRSPALVETLRYTIADLGGGRGELRLEWEQRIGAVPLTMKARGD
jgi:hypothetical protein